MSEEFFEIVVTEDNPADRLLLEEALRTHQVPCRTHWMNNGAQFLSYARKACDEKDFPKPDLIILDWTLPDVGSAQLIAEVRMSPRCADAPILIFTSSISPTDKGLALAAGATRFLAKPARLNEYLAVGNEILKTLREFRSTGAEAKS